MSDPKRETVFVSRTGTQVEPRGPHNWLLDNIISGLDILNEEELKNLTSKAWRHAWANWAKDHERDDIRSMAFAMLSHSEAISDSNYHLIHKDNAAKFSSTVLSSLGVSIEVGLII